MTSSDAGATSSSINSPIAPSPMPTLSNAPSLTLSSVSTTSGNLINRPFAGGLLSSARGNKAEATGMDAISALDLLEEDHTQVESLFEEFEQLDNVEEKKEL